VRHASANHCQVTLVYVEEGLRLTIEDDGVGFTPEIQQRTGRGFGNMEARARQIGATINIASAPGRGTNIVIEMTRKESHVLS
jgi:NarL family two-component system sensor histidine kinase LiaS